MAAESDNFYLKKDEVIKSALLALREIILKTDNEVTEAWKYRMPFFCYRGKRFCYLWVDKRTGWPYLGIVNGNAIGHPRLIREKRARMKIMLIDPEKDLPMGVINQILKKALALDRSSLIGHRSS